MRFPAKNVVQIFRLLEENGVPVWLNGGWGIDALLKRETREHLDLDLIVPGEYLSAAELVLGEAGFLRDDRATVMPIRILLRNSEGLQIDIHPVTFKPNGSAEHIDIDRDQISHYVFVHPAAGFSGVGTINGRIVRCTTAADQIRQKVERHYSPLSPARIRPNGASADLEDIISLYKSFGIDEDKTGVTVVSATKQFCLQQVQVLYAQHAELTAQHTELTAQHAELTAQHAELTAQHAELTRQHAELTTQHAELAAQIDAMRASTSWRLTAPMRWTVNWLREYWSMLSNQ